MQPFDDRYWHLLKAFIARRKRAGIPQSILDVRVGWADGYAGKVEVGIRSPRLSTAVEWAQALGCVLTLRPAPGKQSDPRDDGPVQLSMIRDLDRTLAGANDNHSAACSGG